LTTINRWVVLFWGITLSFAFLVAIPEEHFVFRSISVTLVAVLSICYYLYKRYSGKLSLQSDLLISINTLVQFLIPVFYLAFYYQAYPFLDRHNFRYGFAVTSFAALLGQSMFFLGYESIRSSMYFPRVKIREASYTKEFIIFLPLLISIWISRVVLLTTGSYYHIYRSEFQSTSFWFSICTQLSQFGLIIIMVLFIIAFSEERKIDKKRKLGIAIVTLALEMVWHLPSGARSEITMSIVAPVVTFILIKRKVPIRVLTTILLIGIPLFALYDNYRYTISNYVGLTELKFSATLPALIESREWMKEQEYNIVEKTICRYDGQSLNYLLMNYSSDYDWEKGGTYKNIPFVVVPRFIYPEKPVLTVAIDNWYHLVEGGSSPITFWGESYINFSWFGIIAMSFLLGLGMKGYDLFFAKRMSNQYWLCLYGFGAVFIILKLTMHTAVVWIATLLHVIVLAFVFTSLHTVLTKIIHRKAFPHIRPTRV